MKKKRLDLILVERGLFESRERAKSSVMAGVVYVNGERADKPGAAYTDSVKIDLKENPIPYVSRGGLKLEKAINTFKINLTGKTAIDVGASTGGFTDCMLKNGASRVIAVDVGYGQLAWNLRNDERVINLERTNIRYVKPGDIGAVADFVSIDVSFISLKKVLPVVIQLINQIHGEVICLIKPQFEAGREKVGKRGVVRDKELHKQISKDIINFALGLGFRFKGLTHSPVKGPEGNIEYLCYLALAEGEKERDEIFVTVDKAVDDSHVELVTGI